MMSLFKELFFKKKLELKNRFEKIENNFIQTKPSVSQQIQASPPLQVKKVTQK